MGWGPRRAWRLGLVGQPIDRSRFLSFPVRGCSVAEQSCSGTYLGFPLAGPYAIRYRVGELAEAAPLAPVVPMSCAEHKSWIDRQVFLMPEEPTTVFLVSRSGNDQSGSFCQANESVSNVMEVDRFSGRPHVIRLIFSALTLFAVPRFLRDNDGGIRCSASIPFANVCDGVAARLRSTGPIQCFFLSGDQ